MKDKPHADALLASLQRALNAKGTADSPDDRLARFRRKIEAAVERDLWPGFDERAKDLAPRGTATGILSMVQDALDKNWAWVLQLLDETASSAMIPSLRKTTRVGTLNSYIPSAFTTPSAEGHLIVVDNAFHDFIYGTMKYLALATDPVDPTDPLWRHPRTGLPGRFYAAARLLRLSLLTLRWRGFVHFPTEALLPYDLTERVVQDLTEPVEIFILAHEAGHILSNHFGSSFAALGIGPIEVPTLDCKDDLELEADLFGAEVLSVEAVRSGFSPADAQGHALQAGQLLFSLIQIFADYYFIRPPIGHPDGAQRLRHLTARLFSGKVELEAALVGRSSFHTLPLLLRLSAGDFRGDVPLTDFMAEVRASPYCLERIGDDELDMLTTLEKLDDLMSEDPDNSLLAIAQYALGGKPAPRPPVKLATEINFAIRDIEEGNSRGFTLENVVLMEIGRLAFLGRCFRNAVLTKGAETTLQPRPGTTFKSWADGVRTAFPASLALPATQLGALVISQGETSIRIISGKCGQDLEDWLTSQGS